MEEVRLDITEGVAVIIFDRPEVRNAIGLRTIDELTAHLDRILESDVSVLVLTGSGDRAFVSGGDLKELAAIRTREGAIAMATQMRRLLDRIATLPFPVIAALNGSALGGGAEVAVAADIRVAADDARIGFTQVRLGIMPAWGGAERLAEIVGRSQALLLIGTGATLTAEEAKAIGLFDVVLPRPEFPAGWAALAKRFAALGPTASRSIKHVVSAVCRHDHPALEGSAVAAFAELWVSDAHWTLASQPTDR